MEEVLSELAKFNTWLVEITGGEPLLQRETRELAKRLLDADYKVLIETNGTEDLGVIDKRVVKIVDIKCPSSGQQGAFDIDNLEHITPEDEIKFVISNREDYEFAKKFIQDYLEGRTSKVLFAPVRPELPASELAEWILKDALRVRLQVQIHRYIWTDERR